MGGEALVKDIVYKISLEKKDTLLSLSYHRFFKLLNLEKINAVPKNTKKHELSTCNNIIK